MSLEINKINTTRNLLAFSAGIDSTALFFILLENKIPFDIAIVNYNIREESKDEINYAKELAKKYGKQIFLKNATLSFKCNFEKKARDIRYGFFEKIIKKENYETLITAHQLNDKLEWFFMQLSKGAGLLELLGFKELIMQDNYNIYRPLINISKNELLKYLQTNRLKYFIDKTNFDDGYKRNYFRRKFSNDFIKEFKNGVIKSFNYLENDLISLELDFTPLLKSKKLEVFKTFNDDNLNIKIIDKSLKKRGVLLSKNHRDEVLKQKRIVVSHKIAVNITNKYIYIAPHTQCSMPKDFKEICRVKKIPPNIRPYIYKENIIEDLVF